MTKRERVERIIECLDQIRIDEVGGYHSDWVIDHDKVYQATLDAGKDYNAPELVVMPVDEFIKEHEWVLEDDDESDESGNTA